MNDFTSLQKINLNRFGFILLITSAFVLLSRLNVTAQTMVSTTPQNKNFLIEKGTGHTCGSCPDIALKCDTVINSHPGRGILIEYHFGPDAVPQASPLNTDYRTPYGDSILSWPFYLNMMVNRRDRGAPYGSTFIFGPNNNQVQPESDLVITQPSPINLAMTSSFNTTTRLLTVNVEAYYTANSATAINFLQVAITEDSLISTQYDGSYPLNNHFNSTFNHTNVFRANMNGFQGDSVKTTTSGTFVSRTYTYTFPTTPYKWNANHCYLTLYATETKNSSGIQSFAGKIMTAIRGKIGAKALSAVEEISSINNDIVYPNPSNGLVKIKRNEANEFKIVVTDILGNVVYTRENIFTTETSVDLSSEKNGIYFIQILTDKNISVHKIFKTE